MHTPMKRRPSSCLEAEHELFHYEKVYSIFQYIEQNGLTDASSLFYQHGLTLIPASISNYIHYKAWDEITYPFLNFNDATVEV